MAAKHGSPLSQKRSDYATFIAEGSAIEGRFAFTGAVMVNGRLAGEIESDDALVIGDKGVIHASIDGRVVQVCGEVVGDVRASERIELFAGSRIHGDIEAPMVIIEDGAVIEGHCRMTGALAVEPQPSGHDASVVPLKRGEAPR